jgi:hypothetical protein
MSNWTPPRGYKGLRTGYRQAVRVKLRVPEDYHARVAFFARRSEMEDWCEENCHHSWSHVDGFFWFDKTSEAVLFKMIFGGR